jgi:uncharacterized DUF497 family protein
MDASISTHAAEKALERGIPKEGIKAILSGGSTVTLPSKTDPEAVIVFGKYADKIWGVVLNFNTLNVITVRRASKQERRFYEQEIGN